MNQDILILFEDLTYVKTSPPMSGVYGLVGEWTGGLMDEVRSNHSKLQVSHG